MHRLAEVMTCGCQKLSFRPAGSVGNLILLAQSLGQASLWGSAGVLFFNPAEFSEQTLLFVLIIGVTVSSVSTNAIWLLSHTAYLIISTMPMIIMCLIQPDPQYKGMGMAFLAYIGVAYSVARSGSITYKDMMALTLK